MSDEPLLVFSTFPEAKTARAIGKTLVEERLIACVNLLPQVESIYRWQGAVETSSEVLALMKTTASMYPKLETRWRELHPYEVPELIAVNISAGWPAYLDWVRNSIRE